MIKQAALPKKSPVSYGLSWVVPGVARWVKPWIRTNEALAVGFVIASGVAGLLLGSTLFLVLMTGWLAVMSSKLLIRQNDTIRDSIKLSLELQQTFKTSIALFESESQGRAPARTLLKNAGGYRVDQLNSCAIEGPMQQHHEESITVMEGQVDLSHRGGDSFESILEHFNRYDRVLQRSRSQANDGGTTHSNRRFSRAFTSTPKDHNPFFSETEKRGSDKVSDDGLSAETILP